MTYNAVKAAEISLAKSLASAKGVDQKAITDEMMQEFKTAVTRILTPYASAILLDPEWGLPASKARSNSSVSALAQSIAARMFGEPSELFHELLQLWIHRVPLLNSTYHDRVSGAN